MDPFFKKSKPDQSPNPWITHSAEEKYANRWIRISHREVTNPSGNPGIYGVVHFNNIAIGVVPIDEQGNTWLVGQYRYTLGQYHWEIPEGGCPIGEDPLLAAQRELQEETGLRAGSWTPLLEAHLSNSVTDEYCLCYVARDLQPGPSEPEDTELLMVRKLPLSEAVEMALNGSITDAVSVMALLKVGLLYSFDK
jgi:8-oxo-dGTP pyrophosphatase MutT (NUDIX family)